MIAAAGCNRNIEPYDPNEKPREPDLSKIFPEGAQSTEPAPAILPPPPGQPGGPRGAPPLAQADTGNEAPPIEGRVEVAPELRDRVRPGATLFIVARGGQGGGPPLAVKRIPSPEFPLDFSVGPEDRMIKAMPFAGPISLTARLDADGSATTREAGDLEGGAAEPVEPGAEGVLIRLDTAL